MEQKYIYTATIINVVDGDTVDARVDLGFDIYFNLRLRLFGIDTPELNSRDESEKFLAKRAKEFVQYAVLGKTVTIKTYKKDKYGRYLAEIFLGSSMLNQQLIEENLARVYQ